MRYKFYREHKYVSAALNDLERLAAKTDFRDRDQVDLLETQFQMLSGMLKGHAEYEDERIHALLRNKGSNIYLELEDDHQEQEENLTHLKLLLEETKEGTDEEKVEAGYQFYLSYRMFVSDNLAHLYEEETFLLPELQRLYTDEELRQVEFDTYNHMTAEQMAHMMQVLFPHMNPSDHEAFYKDMKDSQPEKFAQAVLLLRA